MEGNAGEWDIPFFYSHPLPPPPPPAKDGGFLQRGGGGGSDFVFKEELKPTNNQSFGFRFSKGTGGGGGGGATSFDRPHEKGKSPGDEVGGYPRLKRAGGGGLFQTIHHLR